MSTKHATIRRGFVDLQHGQIHYRTVGGGDNIPLVMLHQSPGSSKQLERQIKELGRRGRFVIALDTAGNGDSDPLDVEVPTIADLTEAALAAINQLIDGEFDLYGSHTGASIGMEIAIAQPQRVRRLIIDGMGLYSADEQSDILTRYAREIHPDPEALHLMKVWHFCRDQHIFWPYYNHTTQGRLPGGLPDIDYLHDFVVEVLKAMRSYHHSYRAAFRHSKRDRLPLIKVPTLVTCAPTDMLHAYFEEVVSLVPGARSAEQARWDDPEFQVKFADVIEAFLK